MYKNTTIYEVKNLEEIPQTQRHNNTIYVIKVEDEGRIIYKYYWYHSYLNKFIEIGKNWFLSNQSTSNGINTIVNDKLQPLITYTNNNEKLKSIKFNDINKELKTATRDYAIEIIKSKINDNSSLFNNASKLVKNIININIKYLDNVFTTIINNDNTITSSSIIYNEDKLLKFTINFSFSDLNKATINNLTFKINDFLTNEILDNSDFTNLINDFKSNSISNTQVLTSQLNYNW